MNKIWGFFLPLCLKNEVVPNFCKMILQIPSVCVKIYLGLLVIFAHYTHIELIYVVQNDKLPKSFIKVLSQSEPVSIDAGQKYVTI